MPTEKKTAVIYCRVSSDKQKRDETIETQKTITEKIASDNNYNVIERVYDDGVSGTLLESRKLKSLLDRLLSQELKADVVVVSAVDRVFREDTLVEETDDKVAEETRLRYTLESQRDGAFIRGVLNGRRIKLADNTGEHSPRDLDFQVRQMIATQQLDNLRSLCDAAKLKKLKSQKLFSTKPPFGYRSVRDERGKQVSIEVDPVAKAYLIQIFEIIIKHGIEQASAYADEAGIPTPFVYAGYNLKKVNGKWNRGTIERFIKQADNFRTGLFIYKYKGAKQQYQFEPLIDENLYLRLVQANWHKPTRGDKANLLSTKLTKCVCGGSIASCGAKYIECKPCNKRARVNEFQSFLWKGTIVRLLQVLAHQKELQVNGNGNGIETYIDGLKAKLDKTKVAMKNLARVHATGNLPFEEYQDVNKDFLFDKSKLEVELSTLKKQAKEKRDAKKQTKTLAETIADQLKKCLTPGIKTEQRREVLKSVLVGGTRVQVGWSQTERFGFSLTFPAMGNLPSLTLTSGQHVMRQAFPDGAPNVDEKLMFEVLDILSK